MKEKKIFQGQSLFEVLFALAVAALILTAVVSLATLSIRNSSSSRDRTLATSHAQDAVEWLREERDNDWSYLSLHINTYCLRSLSWPSSGACEDTDYISGTRLRREVVLTLPETTKIEANINVKWTDSQGTHEQITIARFTDWSAVDF